MHNGATPDESRATQETAATHTTVAVASEPASGAQEPPGTAPADGASAVTVEEMEATAAANEPVVMEAAVSELAEPASEAPMSEPPVSEAPATSRRSLGPPAVFVRSFDEEQLGLLRSGPTPRLIAALVRAELDVHIRDGQLVAFWGGVALLTLGQNPKLGFVAMLPRKLEKQAGLPQRAGVKGQLACYTLDDEFVASVESRLPGLLELAAEADTRSGPLFYKFMRSNPGSSGVLPIDRQVQFVGLRNRMGGLGVEREGEQRVLLVDLRHGSGADVSRAPLTSQAFFEAATDGDGGLSVQLAAEYRRMFEQRAELGLPGLPTDTLQAGMPVACLIALAHCRSDTVKERMHDAADKLSLPLYLCEFPGSDARIPNQRLWQKLGKG